MTFEELRQFRNTVAEPRLLEAFNKIIIPESTCFIDGLEISSLDGRSCGVESQIKAYGLLYENGRVVPYSFDEYDLDLMDFITEHCKNSIFCADGFLRIRDDVSELELSGKIRDIAKCSAFFQMPVPETLKIEFAAVMYEKMKYLLREQNATEKADLDNQIGSAKARKSELDRLSPSAPVKVRHIGRGVLKDNFGNEYMDAELPDHPGVLRSLSTGEAFIISKRDEVSGDPIEIQDLHEYEQAQKKAAAHEIF